MGKVIGMGNRNRRDTYWLVEEVTREVISKHRTKRRATEEKNKLENTPFYEEIEIIDSRLE